MAQNSEPTAQEIALSVYTSIRQDDRPETIAIQLVQAIKHFRYNCPRINEYQLYHQQPNMAVLKVSCLAAPVYGISVASNGYISVYGGNGMLAPVKREDGRIYAFKADGSLEPEVTPALRHYLDQGLEKVRMGDDNNTFYMSVAISILGFVALASSFMWIRSWRRMSQAKAYNSTIPSAIKDELLEESTMIREKIFKHPTGIYIAQGRRGKRRLFHSFLPAWLYKKFSIKFREMANLPRPDDLEEEDY
ncbi:hypothetical protein QGN29_07300 [Temperatibacter marinus]|uniref:Uncharacterized protein n=1 Tax=Temperatibacter marinus TaxID=1456591 RepID=A0AA52E9V1_9PROT|nr:hypothetical protein [Temperatibacter marinus]WND01367.1 hypothetical protein QGN29_07300 [Temperatibacter marinus]